MHGQMTNHEFEEPLFFSDAGLFFSRADLTVYHDSIALRDFHVEVVGTHDQWEMIQTEKLFGYSPDIVGPIFGGQFDENKHYCFTLRLRPDQATLLGVLLESPKDAITTFCTSDLEHFIRKAESYWLVSVMQQQTPKTQWGMTTKYAATP